MKVSIPIYAQQLSKGFSMFYGELRGFVDFVDKITDLAARRGFVVFCFCNVVLILAFFKRSWEKSCAMCQLSTVCNSENTVKHRKSLCFRLLFIDQVSTFRVLSHRRTIGWLTRHVGKKEIGGTQEPPFGLPESEAESQSPVDQCSNAHVQPILDQNINRVFGPKSTSACSGNNAYSTWVLNSKHQLG